MENFKIDSTWQLETMCAEITEIVEVANKILNSSLGADAEKLNELELRGAYKIAQTTVKLIIDTIEHSKEKSCDFLISKRQVF